MWEYQILSVEHNGLSDIEAQLNEAGKAGWELVQVLVAEMPMRAGAVGLVMKRQRPAHRPAGSQGLHE